MKMMLKKIIPWTLNKQSESSKMKKKKPVFKKVYIFSKRDHCKGGNPAFKICLNVN